jgi:hypothetical protein
MKLRQPYDAGLPDTAAHSVRVRWSMLAFIVVAVFIIGVIAFGDRAGLLDQDNYLDYFREADWSWFSSIWNRSNSLFVFAVSMVTEEVGWRFWIATLNSMGFSPEAGVRITVITLNLLMIQALSKTRWPFISLVLWALLPYGLIVVGLFQIRQGFAFAIAMHFALDRRQPIRGALIASIVHTTFAVPALFLILARFFGKRKPIFGVAVVCAAAVGMSLTSAMLFNRYGGRRIDDYDQQEVYTLNSVIGLTIYLIVPVLVLWTQNKRSRAEDTTRAKVTRQLATMHLGVLVFLIGSYFVYPFAIGRIGYYGTLMIPFMLPAIRLRNTLILWLITVVMLVLGYDVVKTYLEGLYSYFI